MKKIINTTVKTGDTFIIEGRLHTVGLFRKVNGKSVIDIKITIDKTSGVTRQVTTRELNKMLSNLD